MCLSGMCRCAVLFGRSLLPCPMAGTGIECFACSQVVPLNDITGRVLNDADPPPVPGVPAAAPAVPAATRGTTMLEEALQRSRRPPGERPGTPARRRINPSAVGSLWEDGKISLLEKRVSELVVENHHAFCCLAEIESYAENYDMQPLLRLVRKFKDERYPPS